MKKIFAVLALTSSLFGSDSSLESFRVERDTEIMAGEGSMTFEENSLDVDESELEKAFNELFNGTREQASAAMCHLIELAEAKDASSINLVVAKSAFMTVFNTFPIEKEQFFEGIYLSEEKAWRFVSALQKMGIDASFDEEYNIVHKDEENAFVIDISNAGKTVKFDCRLRPKPGKK